MKIFKAARVACSWGILAQIILVVFLFRHAAAESTDYKEEVEKSLSVHKKQTLWISTFKGSITVQGSASDRFRVLMVKKIRTEKEDVAKEWFKKISLRVEETPQGVFVSPERGSGLGIRDKLKIRAEVAGQADFVVMAPSYFQIKASSSEGDIQLRNWTNEAEISVQKGKVFVQNMKGRRLEVLGHQGQVQLKQIVADSVRVNLDQGDVELSEIKSDHLRADVMTRGSVHGNDILGEQTYVTQEGAVLLQNLKGVAQVRTQSGSISLRSLHGAFHLFSRQGEIFVEQDSYTSDSLAEESTAESSLGNIKVILPSEGRSCVDAWSVSGKTHVGFAYIPSKDPNRIGPEPVSHLKGCVSEEPGPALRVRSGQGDVLIEKKNEKK